MRDVERRLDDLERKVANQLRYGTIASIEGDTVRVKIGDIVTGPLPWFERRAGKKRTSDPPDVGETVLVVSPNGDLNQGRALPAGNSNAFPRPASSPDVDRTEYADGTVIEYDEAAHVLRANVKGGIDVQATGNVTAATQANASVTAQGTLDAQSTGPASLKSQTSVLVAAPGITFSSFTGGGGIGTMRGDYTDEGNLRVTENLTVNGNVTIDGDLTVAGELTVGGSTNLNGGCSVTGTLAVNGNITATGSNPNNHTHP